MKQNKTFWITNISDRNVSLADLNLTVKAHSSVNLMDSRHYSYNLEQLEASANHGSIFNKRNKIVVRKFAPIIANINIPISTKTHIPSREKSVYSIKEEYYEELELSDEEFAEENADMIELDIKKPITSRG